MIKLDSCINYFFNIYPHKGELQPHRLLQLLYLADWKSCIDRGKPILRAKWYKGTYGVNSEEVSNLLQFTNYSLAKGYVELSKKEKDILDWVVKITKDKYQLDFMLLIYSTFPIIKCNKLETMDLVQLAKEFTKKGL